MLSDDQFSLVSAAVDRELSPSQVGTFRTLLQSSPEAAQLYRQLTDQSTRLARLTLQPAPPTLRESVLRQIDPPRIHRSSVSSIKRTIPFAIAASVLMAFAVWLVSRLDPGPEVAEVGPVTIPTQPNPIPPEPILPPAVESSQKVIPPVLPITPSTRQVAANVPSPPGPAPQKSVAVPRSAVRELQGAPVFAPPSLAKIEVQLPLLTTVAEFDRSDTQARLIADLAEDDPFRLDLFCRDTQRGAEALVAVAKQMGLMVTMDSTARERIKKKLPTAAYAIYTDSLIAIEVAKLASLLAEFDRRPDQGLFTQAHLVQLREADRKDLRELLGSDPDAPRRPRDKAADATKVKSGEKTGVLVIHQPLTARVNPLSSKEVRDYLVRRDDRRPGAVSLLMTIRGNGS